MHRPIVLTLGLLALASRSHAGESSDGERGGASKPAVLPLPAAFYTPETGVGGGMGALVAYGGGGAQKQNRLVPVAVYTEKRQSVLRLIGDNYWKKGLYHTRVKLGHNRYPDEFYGIGDESQTSDAEGFTEIFLQAKALAERRVVGAFYAGPFVFAERYRIEDTEPGGKLQTEDITGANSGQLIGGGIQFQYNDRDHGLEPRRGRKHVFSASHFPRSMGSDEPFTRYRLRLRRYVPLTTTTTFAGEARLEAVRGVVPFRHLTKLGGQYLLRGYYLGRFRDESLAAVQGEVRQHLWGRIGITGFWAAGSVKPRVAAMRLSDTKRSFGGGLRITVLKPRRIGFRLDYAVARDARAFYFGVGEAF